MPLVAPWSLLGRINERLGLRNIENQLSAFAVRYLNPLLELSENDRLLSNGSRKTVRILREKADLYAQYCGYAGIEALLQAQEMQDTDDYRGFFSAMCATMYGTRAGCGSITGRVQ